MSADRALHLLADRYRRDAQRFRELGQEPPAALLERVALELEDARQAVEEELLSVAEAAEESGYSESRLYTLLQTSQLPNAGEKGSPRVRRRDLPIKGTRLSEEETCESDLADEILEARGVA